MVGFLPNGGTVSNCPVGLQGLVQANTFQWMGLRIGPDSGESEGLDRVQADFGVRSCPDSLCNPWARYLLGKPRRKPLDSPLKSFSRTWGANLECGLRPGQDSGMGDPAAAPVRNAKWVKCVKLGVGEKHSTCAI